MEAAWRAAAVDPSGDLPREVAAHLRHMRGLTVDPACVLITAGARDGLRSPALPQPPPACGRGIPGYPSLRRVPQALGHTLVEIPTDPDGVTVPAADLDALIVTPATNTPTAARCPQPGAPNSSNGPRTRRPPHRGRLRLRTALRRPATARPSRARPGTHRAAGYLLLGHLPSIACGYLVVPPRLRPAVDRVRDIFGQPVGAIPQAALAHYLASGALRRHTGRMRRTYKRRRNLVAETLGTIEGAQLLPIHGGLHAVLLCDPAVVPAPPPAALSSPAARLLGGADAEDGVVLGFGHLSDSELRTSLTAVAAALGE